MVLGATTSAQSFPSINKMPAIDAFAVCLRDRTAHHGERQLRNKLIVGSGAAMLFFAAVRWRLKSRPVRSVPCVLSLAALVALMITIAIRVTL